jgi:hypothetical protein
MKKTNVALKSLLLILLGGAVFASAALLAQAPAPPPPSEPRQFGQSLEGTVNRYLMNPRGEIDGVLLTDGTQIKFPPHMSADLTRAVRPSDNITAQGRPESAPVFTAFSITNESSGQTVVESRPSSWPPPLPPDLRGVDLKPMQAEGHIATLLFAPRGEIEGTILENGTVLRMRPDVSGQFVNLLRIGQSVSAKGYGTENEFGRSLEVTELGTPGQPLTAIYRGIATPTLGEPPSALTR